MSEKIRKSEQEWKKKLSPEVFRVLRKKGTEPPFTGKYLHTKKQGVYRCAGCGNTLFSSGDKFDSGSGWPSFIAPVTNKSLEFNEDTSHGMHRTEVVCGRCGGHLGHVFSDGPKPTGHRFCINSAGLIFQEEQ